MGLGRLVAVASPPVNNTIAAAGATLALLTAIIGGTVTVESRYAKAQEVRSQIDTLYAKTLKLRILELQLKAPSQFTAADRALLSHLQQELREVTSP